MMKYVLEVINVITLHEDILLLFPAFGLTPLLA